MTDKRNELILHRFLNFLEYHLFLADFTDYTDYFWTSWVFLPQSFIGIRLVDTRGITQIGALGELRELGVSPALALHQ